MPTIEYVQFTPLRQALDDRCKRRIRRNHLSEEVNDYEADKRITAQLRKQIKEKDAELRKLKSELETAKTAGDTNHASRSENAAAQSRVAEVEEELETLRRSFGLSEALPETNENWDHIPRTASGPHSEGGDTILIYEDNADPYDENQNEDTEPGPHDQADAALMGLELESARQAKQSMLSSFSRNNRSFNTELDFADSPSKPRNDSTSAVGPATPRTLHHDISKQLKAATSRAEDAELALTALEGEVRAIGFASTANASASASLASLADHFRSIRLELERLMPGETTISFNNTELFPELLRKVRTLISQLNAKEAELKSMRNQERSLKGNFDHVLVAQGKADAKIKGLEKELDDMASESMDTRMRAQELERERDEKSRDNDSLQAALEKYRVEQKRLEDLIETIEGDHRIAMQQVKEENSSAVDRLDEMEAKVSAEETGRRKAEESAVARLKRIQDLETALHKARENAEQVQERLKITDQKESKHVGEVGGLNTRISALSTALANANAEVEKLRQINAKLEQQYRNEVAQGEKAVSRMHEELIKAATRITEAGKGYKRGSKVRLANWELESDDLPSDETGAPMTPSSVVTFAEDAEVYGGESDAESLPESVTVSRGKKRTHKPLTPAPSISKMSKGRRRYDSGIGMSPLTESSEGEEDSGIGGGMASPELSSEADVEMDDGEGVGVY